METIENIDYFVTCAENDIPYRILYDHQPVCKVSRNKNRLEINCGHCSDSIVQLERPVKSNGAVLLEEGTYHKCEKNDS